MTTKKTKKSTQKKEPSIRLSKKHGLQPTMPLCYYCGKAKGTIALLGHAGDALARAIGRSDGEMPKEVWLPGDIDPCDSCAKIGVGIVEVMDDMDGMSSKQAAHKGLTGNRWLVKDSMIEQLMADDPEKLAEVLQKRVVIITEQASEKLGLPIAATTQTF